MREEKGTASKEEFRRELTNLSKRLDEYDWEYRLNRFDEKINHEKEITESILEVIEMSDNNN